MTDPQAISETTGNTLPATQDAPAPTVDDVGGSLGTLVPGDGGAPSDTTHSRSHGRYVLQRICGEGGLGRVWLAVDRELQREVALKEIKPERQGNAALQRRFLQEAQITSQLDHPNI